MATNWVILTAPDIEESLNAGELEEYRQHAATIEDPLPGILTDVTALVRGYVSVRWELQGDGIPAELKSAAVDLVIHRLAKRAHLRTENDEQRKGAADEAMRILRETASGQFGDFGTPKSTTRSAWGSKTPIASGMGETTVPEA